MENHITAPQELQGVKKIADCKKLNQKIARLMRAHDEWKGRAERVSQCGDFLRVWSCERGDHTRVIGSNFCRDRFCALCQRARSRRAFASIWAAIQDVGPENFKWAFVTLTIKNCEPKELRGTLTQMLSGWKKLLDLRKIERLWLGTVRSLEITYNRQMNTYHPHIHALIALPEDYAPGSKNWIRTEELSKMWAECLGTDIAICDMRMIRSMDGGIRETAKYSVKTGQIDDLQVMLVLDSALKHRRLLAASGILKRPLSRAAKIVESQEPTDETIAANPVCPVCGGELQRLVLGWMEDRNGANGFFVC